MRRPRRLFALALLLLAAPALAGSAGPADLVRDLKTVGVEPFEPGSGADFNSYLAVNGRVVFLGFLRPWSDCGLWATDGHPGGTERIVDLCATVPMIDGNSKLRMDASSGSVAWLEDVSGLLWRTDGTSAGTYPLGVQAGGPPPVLGPDGRTLFFSGCASGGFAPVDCEPWRSDGTLPGTRRLRDVHPGPVSSYPFSFTPQGRRVLFIADGAIWSTDGTSEGTKELVRVPGRLIQSLLVHGGQVYFQTDGWIWAFDLASGTRRRLHGFGEEYGTHLNLVAGVTLQEAAGRVILYQFDLDSDMCSLWETDGTPAGTRILGPPSVFHLMDGRVFGVGNGRLVFAAGLGRQEPEHLWSIAPGSRQPVFLTGCPEGCPEVSFDPAVVWRGRLYFAGTDPRHGRELWTTDGTAQGTRRITDLCPGPCEGGPFQLRVALDRLVLAGPDGSLWTSDGTREGTVRLTETGISPSIYLPLDLAVLGDRIVFTGLDPASGRQPFASDLTPQGTDVIDRIGGRLLAASSRPLGLAAVSGRAVFTACDDQTGGLWGSDGTAAGTLLLPGTEKPCEAFPNFDIFRTAGGLAYFDSGDRLWRTDGTPEGTFPLPGPRPVAIAPLGDRLLFVVDPAPDTPPGFVDRDFLFGTSDGTPQGTQESFPVPFVSVPDSYFFVGRQGLAFFFASTSAHFGLWRTDGTAAGTFPLLEDILRFDVQKPQAVVLGGKTYFLAYTRKVGTELWVNDGTAAGTTPVFPGLTGPRPLSPRGLVTFQGALYFFASPGAGQAPELWRSDGTAAGTRLVKTFPRVPGDPFYEEASADDLTPVGDQLFFRADTGGSGPELWKTDGTPEGTVLVKDIAPGPASSRLASLTAAGGRLCFTADDGEHGNELWESDGTAAGTRLIQDILPGPASSDPQDLTAAEGILYFTANDGEHGRELWALPPPR